MQNWGHDTVFSNQDLTRSLLIDIVWRSESRWSPAFRLSFLEPLKSVKVLCVVNHCQSASCKDSLWLTGGGTQVYTNVFPY